MPFKAMERLDRKHQSLADAYDELPTFLEIEVGDAQIHGEGKLRYVDYSVSMNTNLPFFSKPQCLVRRRYKDFLWLKAEMERRVRVEVPDLPPRALLKRLINRDECFEPEFIESRREGLERFMNKLASHPLVQNEKCLHVFLMDETIDLDKYNNSSH